MCDEKSNQEEKRKDDRIIYDFPVFFYFMAGKRKPRSATYHKGYTQDVSKNGIKLLIESTSKEVKEKLSDFSSEIGLEIYLPAVFRSRPITCKGKLIWSSDLENQSEAFAVGIELLNLDAPTGETLKKVAKTLRKITDDIIEGD